VGKTRVLVVLRRGLDPADWEQRFARGETWDRTPYGYDRAGDEFDLTWTKDHPETRLGGVIRSAVRSVLGFDLVHVWRNRRALRSAEAVWTHTEREHLAVAFLKWRSPTRYPARSIAQSVWLWDNWERYSGIRRRFYRKLLALHDVELVLSRENREYSELHAPGRSVLRVPFGTEGVGDQNLRAVDGDGTILAIGNDRHRDWDLLATVATAHPQLSFVVSSFSRDVQSRAWPGNITVSATRSARELARMYAQASVAVIPLVHNLHASGCTVAIEAISAGIPLVVSDAGGIDEYVEGSGAHVVPVGDAEAFGTAILAAVGERGAAAAGPAVYRERGLTQADYVQRYAMITRDVLSGSAFDPDATRFVSVIST
jgi:glycosyltransferase involved in cell wall biosynthesis